MAKPLITICARAGSKGLPGKNWKEFCGKPLICHTIEQAMKTGINVAISTNSRIIRDIVRERYNSVRLFVKHRSPELSKDNTPKLDVIRDLIQTMEYLAESRFSHIIDLDVTNPLRLPTDIPKFIQYFEENTPEVLVSVTESKKSPYFNQVVSKNNRIDTVLPYTKGWVTSRQESYPAYDMNASIHIYCRRWLLNHKVHPLQANYGQHNHAGMLEMQPWQAFDIDTELDFQIAEHLAKIYMGGKLS